MKIIKRLKQLFLFEGFHSISIKTMKMIILNLELAYQSSFCFYIMDRFSLINIIYILEMRHTSSLLDI